MGLGAIGAFAQGFADSRGMIKDREQRKLDGERQDRMIEAMGAVPPVGSPMASNSQYGVVQPGSGGLGYGSQGNGSAQGGDGSLFGLIDKHEGGGAYNTLFGHSQNGGQFDGVDVSQMTIGQAIDFASPSGAYGQWVKGKVGRVATPMGRHQIVGSTLKAAAKDMGLSADTPFNAATQDMIASHLASKRLASASGPEGKRIALRSEWEGFKHVSDAELDQAIATFEKQGGALGARPMGAVRGAGRPQ